MELLQLRVATLPRHDVILGKPWLEYWNPIIDWRRNDILLQKDSGKEIRIVEGRKGTKERRSVDSISKESISYDFINDVVPVWFDRAVVVLGGEGITPRKYGYLLRSKN